MGGDLVGWEFLPENPASLAIHSVGVLLLT